MSWGRIFLIRDQGGTSRLSYFASVHPGAKSEVDFSRFPAPGLAVTTRSERNSWLIAADLLTLGSSCLMGLNGQSSLLLQSVGHGLGGTGFNSWLCWL